MKTDRKRRQFVLGLGALIVPAGVSALLDPTPKQGAGPFYPDPLPLDDDNDLTRVDGDSRRALGEIADLSGRLLDIAGRPLAGRRIEIWQCDANGRYRHPYDQGSEDPDPGFQGFGATVTDADGRYRFRTIRPVPYPGRTPHIHIAIPHGHGPRFTTQMYVAGEPRNDRDFLYRRIPADLRARVVAEFRPSPNPNIRYSASFDIILGQDHIGEWKSRA